MKSRTTITLDQIKNSAVAHLNQHLFESGQKSPLKKHKYGATKSEVNGIVFDSKKEANRYKELLLLLKAGAIGILQLRKPSVFLINSAFVLSFVPGVDSTQV